MLGGPALYTYIGGIPDTLQKLRSRYQRLCAGSPDPDRGRRTRPEALVLRVNRPLPPYSFVDAPSSQRVEGGMAAASGTASASRDGN